MKGGFFPYSLALQLMSGQKVTVCSPIAEVCLKEPGQQQLPPSYWAIITAEASALFEFSQELPPPQLQPSSY